MSLGEPRESERVTGAMIQRTTKPVPKIIDEIRQEISAGVCLEIGMGNCAMLSPSTTPDIKGILSRGFGPCQPVSIVIQNPRTSNFIKNDTFCYLYHAHPGIELSDDLVKRLCKIPKKYSDITIMCCKKEYSYDPNVYDQIIRVCGKLIHDKIIREINIIEHDLHRSKLYDGPGETFILTRSGWLVNEREFLGVINTYDFRPWGIPTGELCNLQDPKDPDAYLFSYELGFKNVLRFEETLSHLPPVLVFANEKYLSCDEIRADLNKKTLSNIILRERCERWFASRGCLREYYPFHLMTVSDDGQIESILQNFGIEYDPILIKNNTTQEIYIVGDVLQYHSGIPRQTNIGRNINPLVYKGDILMKSYLDVLSFPPVRANPVPVLREVLDIIYYKVFEYIVKKNFYIPALSNTRRFLTEIREYESELGIEKYPCSFVRSVKRVKNQDHFFKKFRYKISLFFVKNIIKKPLLLIFGS